MRPFGAVLAGGQSRRYGSPKALAPVGGERIMERVISRLRAVAPDLVLLANEPGLFDEFGLPTRADARPGLGALGGVYTALLWAREEGRPGILAVACDMPFLSVPLLRHLASEAFRAAGTEDGSGDQAAPGAPDLVVPESRGRRGIEPLCAAYHVRCLPAIEAALDGNDSRMIGFHDEVRVQRIPLADVEALCDPDLAFLNVNTPEERDRAERLAEEEARAG